MMQTPARVTFVLPGRQRSGGVLVTAAMGNELLRRGYDVRIAWRDFPRFSGYALQCALRRAGMAMGGRRGGDDGLAGFEGRLERFRRLDELRFQRGERVIAVGSMTVEAVRRLTAPVVKMRYCHGFAPHDSALMREAWGFPMPTIAVSESLVERLESLCGHTVLGVVPNGLDERRFFEESGVERNGIGAIYGDHVSKDPETLAQMVAGIRERFPGRPLYLFGQPRLPSFLRPGEYTRMPNIDQVRRTYNRSLIWIVPSRSEGFGMPIIEAMACGAAVVSTRTEGAGTLVRDGVNGLLAGVGDVEGLLAGVERLLHDDRERERLVEQGRRTARYYRWARAADRIEECFDRLSPVERLAEGAFL